MACPNCPDSELTFVLTKKGVAVDQCHKCDGLWLDKGEIYLFAKHPKVVATKLEQALERATPTAKLSPLSGEPMVAITYPGGPRIDYCPRSGGLWFDAGELEAFLACEREVRIEPDRGSRTGPVKASPAAGLRPLPNLFLRSTLTLTGLYALLVVILIAAVELLGVGLNYAVGFGVAAIVLHFLIGPFLIDLTMRWLYRMDWVAPDELPDHLKSFVDRVCADNGIRFPRFGIIDDGAPQAFTYGHSPNNARIVVSRGILELLEPEEVEAVVAHELGHAVHWDMVLMTIAQLVPLVLYYVYRLLIRSQSRSRNNKGGGAVLLVALGAFVLYIISEYMVLWFSRTREYHADRFAGEVTGDPRRLGNALAKIAYGLARREDAGDEKEASRGRGRGLSAVGALGIFDGGAARALAVTSYSAAAPGTAINEENLKGAMRWDLWNPWAKWYELHSTHPLVAHRLRHLSDQAVHMGQEPSFVFDEVKPESYWDEFFVDFAIHLLPIAASLLTLLGFGAAYFLGAFGKIDIYLALALVLLGGALLIRFGFTYNADYFPSMSVAALLKKVKVSAVRPVPCTLQGTVIGRGVPGYIASEDFVMQDDTGIMFLDYRQPLAIWELLFGLLKAGAYQGKEVMVEGWYRRSPIPFVEISAIECEGKVRKSWVPFMNQLSGFALIAIGPLWEFAIFFVPGLLPY